MLKPFLFCGAVCLAAPAWAGWQYTEWGMTAAQVQAAAKGAKVSVAKVTAPKQIRSGYLLKGKHRAGKYSFDVTFRFIPTTGKLAAVFLLLDDTVQCSSLEKDLKKTYGEPHETDSAESLTKTVWQDAEKKNEVSFINKEELFCMVNYFDPDAEDVPPGGL